MSDAREHVPLKPAAFHILLALARDEMHGYAIIGEIEARTGGEVTLHPGILYRFLKRLLDDGLIRELEQRPVPPEEDDERRRYYGITAEGRRALLAEGRRMSHMVAWVEEALRAR